MDKPWEREPDHKEFEYKGMTCEIIRQPSMKHLCGYVTIPLEKKAEGRMAEFIGYFIENDLGESDIGSDAYDKFDEIFNISVHGGITFSRVVERDQGKCFMIGFDCGHYMDLIPSMYEQFKDMPWAMDRGETYRTIEYVEAECKKVVDQILEPQSN